MRKNQEHTLLIIPLELIKAIFQCLTMPEALRFSMSGYLLWIRHQDLLLEKLIKDPWVRSRVDGFYTLIEMLELDLFFKDHPPVYTSLLVPTEAEEVNPETEATESQNEEKLEAPPESENELKSVLEVTGPPIALGHILSCTGYLLPTLINNDPYSFWKLATLSGFLAFLRGITNGQLRLLRDHHGRGVIDYLSLGAQLSCLEHCLPPENPEQEFNLVSDEQNELDPDKKATIMAAAGGHAKILRFFKQRGYNLKCIFPETSPPTEQETLLTYAEMNGNSETIAYLEEEGVDTNVGKGLAFYTAFRGFWKRTTELSEKRTPLKADDEAIYWLRMTEFAIEKGSLEKVLSLIQEHSILPEIIALCVVTSGNAEVFWHFIQESWLTLDQQFGTGQTILHILAMRGHLDLFLNVLKHPRCPKDFLYTLDNSGQSVLHAAARGGRWDIYCYLLANFDVSKLPLVDAAGVTVAHSAAQEGKVWFLRRLKLTNPKILTEVDNEGRTILHAAALCNSPNALKMINEEFEISFEAVDKANKTPLDYLVEAASQNPENWSTLNAILEHYDNWQFLEHPHAAGDTILDYIIAQNAVGYFPKLCETNEASLTY